MSGYSVESLTSDVSPTWTLTQQSSEAYINLARSHSSFRSQTSRSVLAPRLIPALGSILIASPVGYCKSGSARKIEVGGGGGGVTLVDQIGSYGFLQSRCGSVSVPDDTRDDAQCRCSHHWLLRQVVPANSLHCQGGNQESCKCREENGRLPHPPPLPRLLRACKCWACLLQSARVVLQPPAIHRLMLPILEECASGSNLASILKDTNKQSLAVSRLGSG